MTEGIKYARTRVLVIEDSKFIRATVIQVLRQIGFIEIFEAADGASGLMECALRDPHIVICDIEMEPLDGLGFLEGVRSGSDISNRQVPVIFLTKHAESEMVTKAIKAGVNAFVVKPPSIQAIKQKIDALLAQA